VTPWRRSEHHTCATGPAKGRQKGAAMSEEAPKKESTGSDLLVSVAESIGSTLGSLAAKVGGGEESACSRPSDSQGHTEPEKDRESRRKEGRQGTEGRSESGPEVSNEIEPLRTPLRTKSASAPGLIPRLRRMNRCPHSFRSDDMGRFDGPTVPSLPGSLGREDDFGLDLPAENPGRMQAEQRLGQFRLERLGVVAEQRLGRI
jgi:hypothetical protein